MKIKINDRNFKYWFFAILLTGPLFMLNFHNISAVLVTFFVWVAGLLVLTLFYVIETKQDTIDKLNEEISNLKKKLNE